MPETLVLPPNVPAALQESSQEMYRHYLAMTLAIDDMLGGLLDFLEKMGKADNTLVLFASDHGTQAGSQGVNPWSKKNPYDASIHIPAIFRLPGVLPAGRRVDSLLGMADFFPTLCDLAQVPIPRSVEGTSHALNLTGQSQRSPVDGQFLMNFSKWFDWFQDGAEWRGVRTKLTYMQNV